MGNKPHEVVVRWGGGAKLAGHHVVMWTKNRVLQNCKRLSGKCIGKNKNYLVKCTKIYLFQDIIYNIFKTSSCGPKKINIWIERRQKNELNRQRYSGWTFYLQRKIKAGTEKTSISITDFELSWHGNKFFTKTLLDNSKRKTSYYSQKHLNKMPMEE